MSDHYQLLPPLSGEEFAALKADIRVQGVLVAVELDDQGHILDGHHRVRAWEELRAEGLRPEPYPRLIRSGLTEAEKRARVLALNLYRRHLVPNQRAAVLARIKDELGWSNRRIAELAGVSKDTVRNDLASGGEHSPPDADARVIGKDGKSHPAKRKKRTVVTARSDGEERRALEALAHLPEGARPEGLVTTADVAKAARPYRPGPERQPVATPDRLPASLEVADARSLPLDDETVHLVVTSPPYALDKEYLDGGDVHATEWGLFLVTTLKEALRIARPGGRLALNVPLDVTRPVPRPTYAQAVRAAEFAGWTHRFSIVWNEGNVTHSTGRGSVGSPSAPHVIAPVEMIAVFAKLEWEALGPCPHADSHGLAPELLAAIAVAAQHSGDPQAAERPSCFHTRHAPWRRGSDREPDLLHDEWLEWTNGLWTFPGESRGWEGHPAAFPEELPRRLIKLLSFPGDTVLDPFMGSGTTPLVAHRLGREPIGFDLSPEYVASARRRIAAAEEG